MKILFLILFSLFLIPFIYVASAEQVEDNVISFVQIIQRDDAGNLIAYMEYSNVVQIVNVAAFNDMLNHAGEHTIVQVNGINFELIQFPDESYSDASGLMASQYIRIMGNDGNWYRTAEFSHNGIISESDQKIDVMWTFLRPV